MTKDEALKMAIELIEGTKLHDYSPHIYDEVITACKKALSNQQLAQENRFNSALAVATVPRTHPHQWQGLTDDEIDKVYYKTFDTWSSEVDITFARAIEAKLKEKNT